MDQITFSYCVGFGVDKKWLRWWVTSTSFKLGAVRVFVEVGEILQSVKPVPHMHEDLDSISNPYGKSGMRCELASVLGGATGSVGLSGQPVEHKQDSGPKERPWLT